MTEETARDTTMAERLVEYIPVITTFACVGALTRSVGRSLDPERTMLLALVGFLAIWMSPFILLTGIASLVGLLLTLVATYRGKVPKVALQSMWRQVGLGIVGTILALFILQLRLPAHLPS